VSRTTEAAGRLRGGSLAVLVALTAANGLGYLLTLVASRRLGPERYGALAALLGLVLVGNVLALGLQAVVARRVVAGGAAAAAAWAARVSAVSAAGLGIVALLAAPVVTHLLHLPSAWPTVVLAVTLAPLTVIGGQLGLLQGAERLHALAALYLVAGLGKVGGGVVGALVGSSVTSTMVGTAVGATAAAAAGAVLVHRTIPAGGHVRPPSGVLAEIARATYSLGGLFALSNVDVVLARHALPAREAGLYAVGAVVTKAAFWLPSVVPVIALPGLSDPARRQRTAALSLAAVTAAGLLITAAGVFAGDLFVRAIGGSAYLGLADRVWLFAATGALLAVAQLLLYSRLAAEDRRVAAPMWLLVLGEATVVTLWWHDSPTEIVTVALSTAVVLVGLGVVAEIEEHRLLRPNRRPS
jgi:hypothetical protein